MVFRRKPCPSFLFSLRKAIEDQFKISQRVECHNETPQNIPACASWKTINPDYDYVISCELKERGERHRLLEK